MDREGPPLAANVLLRIIREMMVKKAYPVEVFFPAIPAYSGKTTTIFMDRRHQ